jgi:serine/threonine protein kinase
LVAVKKLIHNTLIDEKLLSDFFYEADMLSRLRHPNIITFMVHKKISFLQNLLQKEKKKRKKCLLFTFLLLL